MDCVDAREVLSALRDCEPAGLPSTGARAHLADCGPCQRFEADLDRVGRRLLVAAAVPVPDLTTAIVARGQVELDAARSAYLRREHGARALVAVLGVLQMLLAVPLMLGLGEPGAHALRHLGGLEFGLGLGLIFAAWQPRRAAGILPVVGGVAVLSVILAAVDLAAGRTTLAHESVHLVEVLALIGVWWLVQLLRAPDGSPARRPR